MERVIERGERYLNKDGGSHTAQVKGSVDDEAAPRSQPGRPCESQLKGNTSSRREAGPGVGWVC